MVTSPPYYNLRDYSTEGVVWGGDPTCEHQWGVRSYRRGNDNGPCGPKQLTNVGTLDRHELIRDAVCTKCGAWKGSLGLERFPDEYIEHLVWVFREVWRVLRDDGTLWLNIGDSRAGSGCGWSHSVKQMSVRQSQSLEQFRAVGNGRPPGYIGHKQANGLKPKDMMGIPWKLAFALQQDGCADLKAVKVLERMRDELLAEYADQPVPDKVANVLDRLGREYAQAKGNSWYLRHDVIWAKPNPMTESMQDRPTKAHEFVFLLTKREHYFYDHEAIKEPSTGQEGLAADFARDAHEELAPGQVALQHRAARKHRVETGMRNKRDVWWIALEGYKGAHYAVMPTKLVEPCVLAGTSARGACPECGAPWERIMERTTIPDPTAKGSRFDKGKTAVNGEGRVQEGDRYLERTVGWEPTCACAKEAAYHDCPKDEERRKQGLQSDKSGLHSQYLPQVQSETVGWEPTCLHDPQEPIPCEVLDPFCGSGTVGVVALETGRNFTGIDLNEDYLVQAGNRLCSAQIPLPMWEVA